MGATRSMAAQSGTSFFSRLMNKRLWLFTLLSLVIFATVVEFEMLAGQVLPIRSIEVTSQFQGLNMASLEQAISVHVDAGFFGADVNAIKAAAEQLPWADSVSVRRVWPDRIQLEVTEQNAIARWGDDAVMNEVGELFYPESGNVPMELARLGGPAGTHTLLLAHFRELQPVLAKRGLAVSRLVYNRRRAIELELDNGIQLLIGRVRSVRESSALVTRFAHAYDQTLVNRADKISSVDLRYTNGFSIQWKADETARAGKTNKAQNIKLGKASRGSING